MPVFGVVNSIFVKKGHPSSPRGFLLRSASYEGQDAVAGRDAEVLLFIFVFFAGEPVLSIDFCGESIIMVVYKKEPLINERGFRWLIFRHICGSGSMW
jgi:hypothetical protein